MYMSRLAAQKEFAFLKVSFVTACALCLEFRSGVTSDGLYERVRKSRKAGSLRGLHDNAEWEADTDRRYTCTVSPYRFLLIKHGTAS